MRFVIFKGRCAYGAVNVSAEALAVGLRAPRHSPVTIDPTEGGSLSDRIRSTLE